MQGSPNNLKPKIKRIMTIGIRTNVCEIFLNGWRISQTIWRTQNCLCPHTFLKTQIRNIQRKWYQYQGNIVFTLTSQKTDIAKYCSSSDITRAPCRSRNGETVPRAEKFGDLITADHKLLNEEGESRNRYSYEWISGKNPRLTKKRDHNYLYTGQLRIFCRTRIVITSQPQLVLNIEIKGSVKLFRRTGNIIRSSDDSK